MQDNQGKTALIRALEKGNMELFFALLRKGADVNKKDKDKKTALMWAVEMRNIPALQALLEKKEVDVEERDKVLRLAQALELAQDTPDDITYTQVLGAMLLKTSKEETPGDSAEYT